MRACSIISSRWPLRPPSSNRQKALVRRRFILAIAGRAHGRSASKMTFAAYLDLEPPDFGRLRGAVRIILTALLKREKRDLAPRPASVRRWRASAERWRHNA